MIPASFSSWHSTCFTRFDKDQAGVNSLPKARWYILNVAYHLESLSLCLSCPQHIFFFSLFSEISCFWQQSKRALPSEEWKHSPSSLLHSLPLFNRAWLPEWLEMLGVKWGMCRFSSSLDGLHLALETFGFRTTIVSKDHNDIEGQGGDEPPGKWAGGAFRGFLGPAAVAVGNAMLTELLMLWLSYLLSLNPGTLENSLS